jgi:hypothetical protein
LLIFLSFWSCLSPALSVFFFLVTMDYVASFFDSRSSSWSYASLRNFNKLSSPVQSHLQKVSNKLQVFYRGFVAMRFLLLLLRYYMVCALLRGSFLIRRNLNFLIWRSSIFPLNS